MENICSRTHIAKITPFDEIRDDKLKHALAKIEIENCPAEKVLGPALLVISLQAACFNWIHLIKNPTVAKTFFESRLIRVQVEKQSCQIDIILAEHVKDILAETITQQLMEQNEPELIRVILRQGRAITGFQRNEIKRLEKLKNEEEDLKSALVTTSSIVRKLNLISLGVFLFYNRIDHSTI